MDINELIKEIKKSLQLNELDKAEQLAYTSITIDPQLAQEAILSVIQTLILNGRRESAYNLLLEFEKNINKTEPRIISLKETLSKQLGITQKEVRTGQTRKMKLNSSPHYPSKTTLPGIPSAIKKSNNIEENNTQINKEEQIEQITTDQIIQEIELDDIASTKEEIPSLKVSVEELAQKDDIDSVDTPKESPPIKKEETTLKLELSHEKKDKFVETTPTKKIEHTKSKDKRYSPTVKIRIPKKKREKLSNKVLIISITGLVVSISLIFIIFLIQSHKEAAIYEKAFTLLKNDQYSSHFELYNYTSEFAYAHPDSKIATLWAKEGIYLWGRFGFGEEYKNNVRALLEKTKLKDENYYIALSWLYIFSKLPLLAIAIAREGHSKYPTSGELLLVLGVSNIFTGKLTQGIQLIERAITFDNKLLYGYLWLAKIYRLNNQFDNVKRYLNYLSLMDPNNLEYKIEKLLFKTDMLSTGFTSAKELEELKTEIELLESELKDKPPFLRRNLLLLKGKYSFLMEDFESYYSFVKESLKDDYFCLESVIEYIKSGIITGRLLEIAKILNSYNYLQDPFTNLEKAKFFLVTGRPKDAIELLNNITDYREDYKALLKSIAFLELEDKKRAIATIDIAYRVYQVPYLGFFLSRLYLESGEINKGKYILNTVSQLPVVRCAQILNYLWFGKNKEELQNIPEGEIKESAFYCGDLWTLIKSQNSTPQEIKRLIQLNLNFLPLPSNIIKMFEAEIIINGYESSKDKIASLWEYPPVVSGEILRYIRFLNLLEKREKLNTIIENIKKARIDDNDLNYLEAFIEYEKGDYQKSVALLTKIPLPRPFKATLLLTKNYINMGKDELAYAILNSINVKKYSTEWIDYFSLIIYQKIKKGETKEAYNLIIENLKSLANKPYLSRLLIKHSIDYFFNGEQLNYAKQLLKLLAEDEFLRNDSYYYNGLYYIKDNNPNEAIKALYKCIKADQINLECLKLISKLGVVEYKKKVNFILGIE